MLSWRFLKLWSTDYDHTDGVKVFTILNYKLKFTKQTQRSTGITFDMPILSTTPLNMYDFKVVSRSCNCLSLKKWHWHTNVLMWFTHFVIDFLFYWFCDSFLYLRQILYIVFYFSFCSVAFPHKKTLGTFSVSKTFVRLFSDDCYNRVNIILWLNGFPCYSEFLQIITV